METSIEQSAFGRDGTMRKSRWLCLTLVLVCLSGYALAQTPDPMTALPTPTPESPVGLVFSELAETSAETPSEAETTAPAVQAAPEDASPEPPAGTEPEATDALAFPLSEETGPVPSSLEESPEAFESSPDTADTMSLGPAPECGIDGCPHVWPNEAGEVVAVCDLGRWMLEAADTMLDAPEDGDFEPMTLENGVNVIYRGGHYALSGGGRNACLYVRGGLRVTLSFQEVELLTLKLSQGVSASIRFAGQNRVQTLAANGATVDLNGTGSLTVRNNLNCDALTVQGGSVSLPASARSQNGWLPFRFEAEGAREATLDGAFLTEILSDEAGMVTIWLPPTEDGYTGAMKGTTLEIRSSKEERIADKEKE